jgi:hypothetical protein
MGISTATPRHHGRWAPFGVRPCAKACNVEPCYGSSTSGASTRGGLRGVCWNDQPSWPGSRDGRRAPKEDRSSSWQVTSGPLQPTPRRQCPTGRVVLPLARLFTWLWLRTFDMPDATARRYGRARSPYRRTAPSVARSSAVAPSTGRDANARCTMPALCRSHRATRKHGFVAHGSVGWEPRRRGPHDRLQGIASCVIVIGSAST